MKTLVCYPLKTLVSSFVPEEFEVIAVDDPERCFTQALLERPDVVILFSEAFHEPIWEWLPTLERRLSADTIKIIVPLHRDEVILEQMIDKRTFQRTYIIPASASHEEIRQHIRKILGFPLTDEGKTKTNRDGQVIALNSYGGAGVSTFCINYPVIFAKRFPDTKIAVIDMNVTKPDLTYFFQLFDHQLSLYRPDLVTINTAQQRDWSRIFKPSQHTPNLFYASGTCHWRGYEISTLTRVLREYFDYIFLDWGVSFLGSDSSSRLLLEADMHLFFTRPDPFSLFSARNWDKTWKADPAKTKLVVSHCDQEQLSPKRMKDMTGIPVCAMIPKLDSNRIIQSLKSSSVLVEELFPPKNYTACLTSLAVEMKRWKGVAVS